MMDTSKEAVERLARTLERTPLYEGIGEESAMPEEAATALRALLAERDRMREALLRWRHYGCPDCGGDCGSANPLVSCCIMQETRAALKGDGDGAL